MQIMNWLSHIIVFGGDVPHLILDNLPIDYVNPYGHSTQRKALLIPADTMTSVRPNERRDVITTNTSEPLGIIGSEAFSDFVRNLATVETNDRYKGFVTGDIEFHTTLPSDAKRCIDGSCYHYLKHGLAVVRCTKIEFSKRLGYFMGNRIETVPPWWS